jgi:hypothetical protein
MAWAARLDKGKGYELNVKPVNILSGTGRVEDDVALMNQAILFRFGFNQLFNRLIH